MKTKHFYRFDNDILDKMDTNVLDINNWEILRVDSSDSSFCIEKSVEKYENSCMEATSYQKTAHEILKVIKKHDISCEGGIVSFGVGKGILEWHIKNIMPQMKVICTDYTETAITQLDKVFLKADEICVFDMLKDSYDIFDKSAIFLMHRVSTEFDRECWDEIFQKLYMAEIEHIIYIPTGLDTFKTMSIEKINHLINILLGRKDVFCGWLYNERELKKIFRGKKKSSLYIVKDRIPLESTAIYLLERNTIE